MRWDRLGHRIAPRGSRNRSGKSMYIIGDHDFSGWVAPHSAARGLNYVGSRISTLNRAFRNVDQQ